MLMDHLKLYKINKLYTGWSHLLLNLWVLLFLIIIFVLGNLMKIFDYKLSIWWWSFKVSWYIILAIDNIFLFLLSISSFLLFFLDLALLFPILFHLMFEIRLVIFYFFFFIRRLTVLFDHWVYNCGWLVVIFV